MQNLAEKTIKFHCVMKTESEVAQLCLNLWTLWIIPYQAPLYMGFSGQQYWSGLPFPSPGDLPTQG